MYRMHIINVQSMNKEQEDWNASLIQRSCRQQNLVCKVLKWFTKAGRKNIFVKFNRVIERQY